MRDGRVDGAPLLGIDMQTLENRAIRSAFGLAAEGGGVLVSGVESSGSAQGVLQPGDVLLRIDGRPIGRDGMAEIAPGIRVGLGALMAGQQIGGRIDIECLRAGQELELQLAMRPGRKALNRDFDSTTVPYRIYAGLVFQVVDLTYLALFENGGPAHLQKYALANWSEPRTSFKGRHPTRAGRKQAVVVSRLLRSPLNRGYEFAEDEVGSWTDRGDR